VKAKKALPPKTPKKIKRVSVSQLKKKADAAFSIYIRYRTAWLDNDEWVVECVTCGQVKPVREMQNGHFVSRRVTLLRYDKRNCNPQCPRCNVYNQGELYLYGLWLDRNYGDGTAEELMSQRFLTHKLTIPELEEIIRDSRQSTLEIHPYAFTGRTKSGAKPFRVALDT
jgi:hypothetical protein